MTTWKREKIYKIVSKQLLEKGFVITQDIVEACCIILRDSDVFGSNKRVYLSQRTARKRLNELANKGLFKSVKVGKTWRWLPVPSAEEVISKLAEMVKSI